jgi:hypothetical protein
MLLTGLEDTGPVVLGSTPHPAPAQSALPERLPLSAYDSMTVYLDERPLGLVVTVSPEAAQTGLGTVHSFAGGSVRSLLGLVEPGKSIVDACLIPLGQELQGGETVSWKLAGGDRVVGTVALVDPNLPLGFVVVDDLRFLDRQFLVSADGAGLTAGATLELAGHPLLQAWSEDEGLSFAPPEGAMYRFAALPGAVPAIDDLPGAGTWDLLLERRGTPGARVPLAAWSKRYPDFAEPFTRLERPLAR